MTMHVACDAIVVAVRPHGEHGAVVRVMTEDHGLLVCYISGAKGRQLRPVLLAGNKVRASLNARGETQLLQGSMELIQSRGPLLGEPLPAAAIDWVAALTASSLPEGQPYPHIYAALDGLLAAVEAAPAASAWGAALVRYELLLLNDLGYGLDLEKCAMSGDYDDLVAVSPKSGRAVGRAAAAPFKGKLLPLPAFLRDGGAADWQQILLGLELTGHFLARDILVGRSANILDSRARLVERLRKAAGLA